MRRSDAGFRAAIPRGARRRLECLGATAAVLAALSGCATPDTLTPTRFGTEACSIDTSDVVAPSGPHPTSAPEPRNVIACWDLE
jgi:hypothetical protein